MTVACDRGAGVTFTYFYLSFAYVSTSPLRMSAVWLPRTIPSTLKRDPGRWVRNTLQVHPASSLALLSAVSERHRSAPQIPSSRRHQSTSSPEKSNDSLNSKVTTTPSETKTSAPAKADEVPLPLSTRVWKKVKHEAQHYWHGSKLLVSEVRISGRLQWKILHGESLTRRERRQVRISGVNMCSVLMADV